MTVARDIETGRLLGQVVDINALSGMIRLLVRGGGYRSVLAEYVRLEEISDD